MNSVQIEGQPNVGVGEAGCRNLRLRDFDFNLISIK